MLNNLIALHLVVDTPAFLIAGFNDEGVSCAIG